MSLDNLAFVSALYVKNFFLEVILKKTHVANVGNGFCLTVMNIFTKTTKTFVLTTVRW